MLVCSVVCSVLFVVVVVTMASSGAPVESIDVDAIIEKLLEVVVLLLLAAANFQAYYHFQQVRGCRPGKGVQLTDGEIRALCNKSRQIFLEQPNLLELEAPIKICGMCHHLRVTMW